MNWSAPYDNMPLVSVVVTTRNEAKNIEPCLQSIRAQTYDAIEIIVVDNHSTDLTLLLAKPLADQISKKGPERAAQRNHGMIKLAHGKYVMYIDADMILSPCLIEACVQNIQKTDVVALHISETILGTSYFSKVRCFERSFYDGTPIDGARFFNREIFCQVGGFDEELFKEGSGEDWDIDKKIKQVGKIGLLPRISTKPYKGDWPLASFILKRGLSFKPEYIGIYHNESEFKLIPYLRKKSYYTKGFDGYIKKWGKTDPDVCCQFGLKYRYWTIFMKNGKWKHVLQRLDLAFGMYILRFLVGVIFIFGALRNKDFTLG